MLLLWDGLGFFKFDDNKLERLKGIHVKWYDRFKNKRWIIFNFVAIILVVGIIVTHLNSLGTVKSQTINHLYQQKYRYNAANELKLISSYWFNLKDVVDRLNIERHKTIPDEFKNFTWIHKEIVQEFLCDNIKFQFVESKRHDKSTQ